MNYSHITSLYKYKKIDKRFLESLKQQSIYSPTISELNDPFEGHIKISNARVSKKELLAFINSINNTNLQEIKVSNGLDMLKAILYSNNMKIPLSRNERNIPENIKAWQNAIKECGILSFTVDNASLLMWSHYADSHKGVCIEFERNDNNLLGSSELCFPVQYSSFINEIDNDTTKTDYVIDVFRMKSAIWTYEKEWRLIVENGSQQMPYPGQIKAIYFGLNTTNNNIKIIKSILINGVRFYKAKVKDNFYKIEYEEI